LNDAIWAQPGISRGQMRDLIGTKVRVDQIEEALAKLRAEGKAHCKMVKPAGGGRPAECWWPGEKKQRQQ